MKHDRRPSSVTCLRLVGRLLAEARDRKRRLRERMNALRGDDVRPPSRGPLLPNGRKCIRWHFYKLAKANHRMATEEVAVLSPPNAMAMPSGDGVATESKLKS